MTKHRLLVYLCISRVQNITDNADKIALLSAFASAFRRDRMSRASINFVTNVSYLAIKTSHKHRLFESEARKLERRVADFRIRFNYVSRKILGNLR